MNGGTKERPRRRWASRAVLAAGLALTVGTSALVIGGTLVGGDSKARFAATGVEGAPIRPFVAELRREHHARDGTVLVDTFLLRFRSFADWRLKNTAAYTVKPDGTRASGGMSGMPGGTIEQSEGHRRFFYEDTYDMTAIPQSVQQALAPWYWQLPPEKQHAVLEAAVAAGLGTKGTYVLSDEERTESSPDALFDFVLPPWRWSRGAEIWLEETKADVVFRHVAAKLAGRSVEPTAAGGKRIKEVLEVVEGCRSGAPEPCPPGEGPPWRLIRTFVFDAVGTPVELVVDFGNGEREVVQLVDIRYIDATETTEPGKPSSPGE